MLQIKHRSHLDFPHITFGLSRPMQFSSVTLDDDIDQEIASDQDKWQLTETVDEQELEQFWNNVQLDIERDPEWVTFAD